MRRLLLLWVFPLVAAMPVGAGEALDTWRSDVETARRLAENDIPAAHAQILRLQANTPGEATPADRVRLLNVLARIETYGAQTGLARRHIREALTLAAEAGDRVGQAEAALNQVLNALHRAAIDDMAAAINVAMTALEGSDRVDLQSEAILRAAMFYLRQGQVDDSVELAARAMEIAKDSGAPLPLMHAYQGLAIIYNYSGNRELTYQYYQRMAEQARAADSRLWLAYALYGQADELLELENVAVAEERVHKGIELCREVGAPFCVAQGLYTLADSFQRQGRHAEALPLLDELMTIYQRHVSKLAMWWTLGARSTVHQALDNREAAQRDAEQGYALAEDIGLPLYLGESARRLAELTAAAGDYRRAYGYMADVAQKKEGVEEDQSSRLIEALAKRYETESKQRRIRELTQSNERQVARQRLLLVVLVSVLLMLVGSAGFLVRLRRSHRLLQESNTRLQFVTDNQEAILDALPDLLFELGPDGRYFDFHTSRTELLAASPELFIGRTVAEVLPSEAAGTMMAALREARAGGTSFGRQYRLSLEGGERWFELSVARKGGDKSGASRFIVLSRDVTTRRLLQMREQMQRRMFEALIRGWDLNDILALVPKYVEQAYSNTGVSVLLADEKGQCFDIAVSSGLPGAFVVGLRRLAADADSGPWRQIADEEVVVFEDVREHPHWVACHQAALEAGLPACWSIPICGTAGNILGVVNIHRRQTGGPTAREVRALWQSSQVITIVIENRRMDRALRASERDFRTLVTNSPDFISRFDAQGRRTYINRTLEPLSPEEMGKLLGKTPVEVSPSAESRRNMERVLEVCRTRRESTAEISHRHKDGRLQWLDMRYIPEFDPAGKVTSVLAIGRDITELKQAKQSLEASYAQLQELAASQESAREEERHRISRELHDELGQMLTAIRLEAAMLKLRYGQDDRQFQDSVAHIVSMVDNTIGEVRNVVSLLRPVALERGIVDALEWLADEFASYTGRRCVLALDGEQGNIILDEAYSVAIFRIVQESLTNVVRHSGADTVHIRLEHGSGGCRLRISDNGRGFDPAQQKEKSTGLLGIRERVSRLNGHLSVSSEPGRGVTLAVYLPTAKSLNDDMKING